LCCACLIGSAQTSHAQTYNYLPFSYFSQESNPATLAYSRKGPYVHLAQQGAPFGDGFNLTQVDVSKYYSSVFSGIGLSAGNTRLSKDLSYQHVGLGAAYRNILGNKVYLKLGGMVKFVNTTAPKGVFDVYAYHVSDTGFAKTAGAVSGNYSVAFSSPSDFYYVSIALLNHNIARQVDAAQFPTYGVIQLGNLANRSYLRSWQEITGVVFIKTLPETTLSYGLNLFRRLLISRHSALLYGLRAGYIDNNFYHFTPSIKWHCSSLSRGFSFFQLSLGVDLGYDKKSFNRQFDAQPQVQFTLQF